MKTASNSSSKGSAWPSTFCTLRPLAAAACKQLLAQIGPQHIGAIGGDRLRQHAVAAAKIENAFALARREEVDHGTGKLRDEAPFTA